VTHKPSIMMMNQEFSTSIISTASEVERQVNHLTDLINASAKEEADEVANRLNNMSFEKYLKNAHIVLDSRSTAVRHQDSSRLGDRSISSQMMVSKG
jgi:enoyl-[acyl-carrier-protein] reductase (NADH)